MDWGRTGLSHLAPELIHDANSPQTIESDIWSAGNLLLKRILAQPLLSIDRPGKPCVCPALMSGRQHRT